MRLFKTVLLVLTLCLAAYPQESQTQDLGLGAFANDKSSIMLAVDASLANVDLTSPYVMFVVYMAAKKQDQEIVVARDGVVMVCKGKEYRMPSLQDLRKNYRGEIRDVNLYRHLGKEGLISSWMRFYDFPLQGDFFPPLTLGSQLPRDEGSMYNFQGFRTKCYFKNPGFQKGDKFVLKVTAKNNPSLTGEVEVTLK
jgi:hypothetical protein